MKRTQNRQAEAGEEQPAEDGEGRGEEEGEADAVGHVGSLRSGEACAKAA